MSHEEVELLVEELIHAVGKLLMTEGEKFRLANPELLDAYEAACTILEEPKNDARRD